MDREVQIDTFSRFTQVSRETIISLKKYENMLLDANKNQNLIGKGTINQIWKRHFLDSALPKVFDYLTDCLGGEEFMVGGKFSIADIAIASAFVNFALAGETVDTGRWPELASYIKRVHAQPCYAPIVKADLEGEFARFRPKDSHNT